MCIRDRSGVCFGSSVFACITVYFNIGCDDCTWAIATNPASRLVSSKAVLHWPRWPCCGVLVAILLCVLNSVGFRLHIRGHDAFKDTECDIPPCDASLARVPSLDNTSRQPTQSGDSRAKHNVETSRYAERCGNAWHAPQNQTIRE